MDNTIALESDAINLPNGTYDGLWSAYKIRVLPTEAVDTHGVTLATIDGCRSLDGMPCTVTVNNGRAIAEAE